jgi:hypothetical protein
VITAVDLLLAMDPIEIIKALPEVGKGLTAVGAAIPFTAIVKKMLGLAAAELAEMWRDQIRMYRYERQAKCVEKADAERQAKSLVPRGREFVECCTPHNNSRIPQRATGSACRSGVVMAAIVWKFFEKVEAVLSDQTKSEIAVWLVDRRPVGPMVEPWQRTFAKVFDRVFGTRHCTVRAIEGSGAVIAGLKKLGLLEKISHFLSLR